MLISVFCFVNKLQNYYMCKPKGKSILIGSNPIFIVTYAGYFSVNRWPFCSGTNKNSIKLQS